ncbi:MAG: insulinase family protein [Bacteroidales bacterium]|nr:insulinase family protein [Bacteroidales bacterium]
MNKFKLLFLSFSLVLFLQSYSQKKYETKKSTDINGFTYEYVENDPIQARIYTLKNGLKIYLSVNKDEPRLQTYIAVKAGSTYDPPQTTGLAHYLEHMMFKGSSKIGTINWDKEKAELDKISDLYELLLKTTDPEKKKIIYRKIDSISTVASKYAVPNEYDKLMSSLGAKGTNAYTSNERTVYVNDIPANEIEKWLILESERFSLLVLRLFHTELETVYEEFNMYQDNDNRKVIEALFAGLFAKHPYGTQTVIGRAEHLKNPSMVNIHKYKEIYYRPDNMAVCLSGDLDFDKTIQLIDKYFGAFIPNNNLPAKQKISEEPIKQPIIKTVYGPTAEFMNLAYRFNGKKSIDEKYITLINMLLSNGKAGLIDLNLKQKQKVLNAGSWTYILQDYGMLNLYGTPREGQSLEQVKDLLLTEINKIKKGEFPDWLLGAVINDLKLSNIKSFESNSGRASAFVDAFANSVPWADRLTFIDELEKISKQDIINFANKNFTDNYVVVYKKTGKDENVVKVEKPTITPININRDNQSEFYNNFSKIKSERINPVFVDFDKEISKTKINNNIELNYIQNNSNELFSAYYIFDMGLKNNKLLPLAFNYFKYLGTNKYSPEQLKQEFYKLGIDYGVSSGNERAYIYINGLGQSAEKGLQLLEHFINNVKADKQIYNDFVDGIIKERNNAKLDKGTILWSAMSSYAKYGKTSPFTDILSTDELKALNPEILTDIIKDLFNYKHYIFYYGSFPNNIIKSLFDKIHTTKNLKDYPPAKIYKELSITSSQVYLVDYDMVQSNLAMLTDDGFFDPKLLPETRLFNEFYGSGLSSIVFQEIRESKALAYSAYSNYMLAQKTNNRNYLSAYIGTQPDKLKTAIDAISGMLNKMPKADKQFEVSKDDIMKKIESERITKENIFWTYLSNKDRNLYYDTRKDIYEKMKTISLNEFSAFFNKHISGKKYTYLILCNKKNIDLNLVQKLGDYKELSLEEIFNY